MLVRTRGTVRTVPKSVARTAMPPTLLDCPALAMVRVYSLREPAIANTVLLAMHVNGSPAIMTARVRAIRVSASVSLALAAKTATCARVIMTAQGTGPAHRITSAIAMTDFLDRAANSKCARLQRFQGSSVPTTGNVITAHVFAPEDTLGKDVRRGCARNLARGMACASMVPARAERASRGLTVPRLSARQKA